MKNWLIEFICLWLVKIGFVNFIRRCYAGSKITIINYHDPDPVTFEKHLKYWQHHYSIIGIKQLKEAIESQDFSLIPKYALLITFDDGHKGNIKLLPIFKKYKVPIVIYVTTGLINSNRHFWWKHLQEHDFGNDIETLKKMQDFEFENILQDKYDFEFNKEYSERHALNSTEILQLNKVGITIGAHSVNHRLLDKCSDEILNTECMQSKLMLEKLLQQKIEDFALPNGNYDQRVILAVKNAGFMTNRTVDEGLNDINQNIFLLKNFGILDDASVYRAALQAVGIIYFFKKYGKRKHDYGI